MRARWNEESQLHAQIAADFEKVVGLDDPLRELTAEREDWEMRWLELAEDV
ncbi:hypothetical protein Sgleb_44650 [Streptomyces glebosus]|uniref:ABC transporter Uup C-terminal domain-containing protein n=1 Tax=Streptomyces glebosus TaxID=249580 RepID=A0A640SZE2_9ACTN|nr:hypothetical protein [Streptomyces glebosus]GFE16418.1 hypothetical protein Sgleb_44650 [Streptomyces glebosus]GHG64733.1 hypothetical protein GCM10010513_33000 [Streptomyces glebosus]